MAVKPDAATRTRRVWSFAGNAADSDALSTAFFVMTDAAVVEFCQLHPEYGAVLTLPDGSVQSLGEIGDRG